MKQFILSLLVSNKQNLFVCNLATIMFCCIDETTKNLNRDQRQNDFFGLQTFLFVLAKRIFVATKYKAKFD